MDCELSAATACVKVHPIKHKGFHLLQTLMTRKGLDINASMLEWSVLSWLHFVWPFCFLLDLGQSQKSPMYMRSKTVLYIQAFRWNWHIHPYFSWIPSISVLLLFCRHTLLVWFVIWIQVAAVAFIQDNRKDLSKMIPVVI
jgi:hypothetical protein